MKITEILAAAKALIPDEGHWWRGEASPPTGCYCPITAIRHASGAATNPYGRVWRDSCRAEAVYLMAIPDANDISHWNDAPQRTLANVHAAFDRAIELASP